MSCIDEIEEARGSVMQENERLMAQYERLKQREAELEADKTLPPADRLTASFALMEEYIQIILSMRDEVRTLEGLKEQLNDADADADDEDGEGD